MPHLIPVGHGLTTTKAPYIEQAATNGQMYIEQPYELYSADNHHAWPRLSRREFPTTITIRDGASLDYLPEPDIFHDIAGHVPMHTSGSTSSSD